MIFARHKGKLLLFLVSFYSFTATSQKNKIHSEKGIHFVFGPSAGVYKTNSKHTIAPYTKAGGLAGFRKAWRLDREHRNFFLTGIDYFYHGLGFKSYYFLKDSIKLYDKSFAYDYSLMIHELHLPLQLKFLFKRRDARFFSSYLQVGYHFRYLLGSDLKVTLEGSKVRKDSPPLRFKNKFIADELNSFALISYGIQKNSIGSSKGNYFAELSYRYGFSPYYFERNYAASSLFMSSSHFVLLLGIKL